MAQTKLKMIRHLADMPQPDIQAKRSYLVPSELPPVYHFAYTPSPKRSKSPTKTKKEAVTDSELQS
jgi:hypothetical protein